MKLKKKDLIENEIYVVRSNYTQFDWIISYKNPNNDKGRIGFSIYKEDSSDNYHYDTPSFCETVWENIRKPTSTELEYYHAYKEYLKKYDKKLQYLDFLENIKIKIYELW